MGASPTRLPVISMARISSVSASIPKWTLRQSRGWDRLCFMASHSPSPSAFTTVLSIKKRRAPVLGRVGNMHRQGLLAAAKGAVARHRPIQPSKLQKARHHTCRLPQWQTEMRLQRQACLDCGVGEHGLTPAPASRRGQPLRLGIEPDRQRSTHRQRLVVGMPVRGAVGRGLRSAHAA